MPTSRLQVRGRGGKVVVRRKSTSKHNFYSGHDKTLEQRFREFRTANPKVEVWLADRALELRARGRRRYSMSTLIQVARWESDLKANDPNSTLKINNDFSPLYARLLMRQHPELHGFFELRKQRTPRTKRN
jgi:hypothetical protein